MKNKNLFNGRFVFQGSLEKSDKKIESQPPDNSIKARTEEGKKISSELLDDKRFSVDDIEYLVKAGISAKEANSYDKRFSGYDIKWLVKAGISAKKANSYDMGVSAEKIIELEKKKNLSINK